MRCELFRVSVAVLLVIGCGEDASSDPPPENAVAPAPASAGSMPSSAVTVAGGAAAIPGSAGGGAVNRAGSGGSPSVVVMPPAVNAGGQGGAPAPVPACPPLNAIDGDVAAPKAVIAEIAPLKHIIVHNNTDEPLPTDELWFCSNKLYYEALSDNNPDITEIPPRGYAKYRWQATRLGLGAMASREMGELLLFRGSVAPARPQDIWDYVCWGSFEGGRRFLAMDRYPGDCAPAMTEGALTRLPDTTGQDAASYDATGQPNDCQ